jgi:putative exosortase-associated protein (TIGR04073 family)
MKKILIVFSAAMFLLSPLSFAQAKKPEKKEASCAVDSDKIKYEKSPVNKLLRGSVNTVTFWFEVPAGIYKVSEERDPFLGWTLGFTEGVLTSMLRLVTGIADMATCIIPPYAKPFMQPEYAYKSLEEKVRKYNEDN